MRPLLLALAALSSTAAFAVDLDIDSDLVAPGDTVTITVSTLPHLPVIIAASAQTGNGPCPPVLRGDCLDIVAPHNIARGRADATGSFTTTVALPDGMAAGTYYIQGGVIEPQGVGVLADVVPLEVCSPSVFYTDADDDGFGADPVMLCELTDGYSDIAGDCDDSSADANPGVTEICDGLDNNCDSNVDEGNHRVPQDLPTIADAIATAADGDAICIAAGTYTETIDLTGRSLTLLGAGGSASTIIDGDGASPVLDLDLANGSVIDGFTITGGISSTEAAGISAYDVTADLRNLVVSGNVVLADADTGRGAGLMASEATLTVSDCLFQANEVTATEADATGAGAMLSGGSHTFTNVVFDGNLATSTRTDGETADANGAGLAVSAAGFTGDGLEFTANISRATGDTYGTAQGAGAHIDAIDDAPMLSNSVFEANEVHAIAGTDNAYAKGAGLFASAATLTLETTTFRGHIADSAGDLDHAYADGGALCVYTDDLYSTDLVVEDTETTVRSNEALGYINGAAVTVSTDGWFSFERTTITGTVGSVDTVDRSAYVNSAGMRIYGVSGAIEDFVGVDNRGSAHAVNDNTYVYGGALLVYADELTTIADALLTDNALSATDEDASTSYAYGGGMSLSGPFDLTRVRASSNSLVGDTVYGGGIRLRANDAACTVRNVIAGGNTTVATNSVRGGGMYVGADVPVTLSQLDIVGNTATADDTVSGGGLLMDNDHEVVSITNANIVGNTATAPTIEGSGLGFYYGDSTNVTLSYTNLYNNDMFGSDNATINSLFAVDPSYVDASSADADAWDLNLALGSDCIDAGDPTVLDADGSPSDIGAMGGTSAW